MPLISPGCCLHLQRAANLIQHTGIPRVGGIDDGDDLRVVGAQALKLEGIFQRAVQLAGPHGARSASLGGDGELRFFAGAQPAHGKAQIQPVLIAYDEGKLHLRLRPAAAGIVARDGGHSGKGVAPRAAVGRGSHFHLARSVGLIRPRHTLPDADAVDPGIDLVCAAQDKLIGKDALLQLGIDHALPHSIVRRAYDGARLSSIFIPGHNGKEIPLRLVLAVCPCIVFLCDILRRLRAFGLAGLRIVRIRSGGRLVLLIRLRLALRPALLAAVFLGLRRDRLVHRLLRRLFSAGFLRPDGFFLLIRRGGRVRGVVLLPLRCIAAGNALAAAFLAAGGAVLSRSGAGAAAGIGAAAAQKRDMPIRMELRRLRPALRAPCRRQQKRRQKRRAKQHAAAPAKDPVFKKFLHRCSREAFPAENAADRSFSKVRRRGGSQVQA